MDPRRRFAETLISALKNSKLPIVVYSGYEERCLKELAGEFPDLAKPIRSLGALDAQVVVQGGSLDTG
jgi:hypothetical protein